MGADKNDCISSDEVDDVAYLEEFIHPTLLPVLHDLAAEVPPKPFLRAVYTH